MASGSAVAVLYCLTLMHVHVLISITKSLNSFAVRFLPWHGASGSDDKVWIKLSNARIFGKVEYSFAFPLPISLSV